MNSCRGSHQSIDLCNSVSLKLLRTNSDKCCWNHSNVIIVLKLVWLLNGVNLSTGGNSTSDSSWAVWLLNSLWPCSPVSFGSICITSQVLWVKKCLSSLSSNTCDVQPCPRWVLFSWDKVQKPPLSLSSEMFMSDSTSINTSSQGSLATGWNPRMMRKGKAAP